jgi:hypothetical protein
MAYSSLRCICTVCLQEPVLHLDMSIYTGFCVAPGVSVYKSFVLHMDVSVYKSFVFCAAPGCVCLQELCSTPEVEFLEEIQTEVLRVFLLAIHRHLY